MSVNCEMRYRSGRSKHQSYIIHDTSPIDQYSETWCPHLILSTCSTPSTDPQSMSVSITQLHSRNFQEIKPPTTPRSLRACAAEGIDPSELRYLPISVFELHELNEHPSKRGNVAHLITVRHETHIKTLKCDLKRVQRRFKEHKKEALRKLEISRSNKHRIQANKRRASAAALGLANEQELQQILKHLNIDPNAPPSWLDVDNDGSISQEELLPLRDVMKRMAVEKKRQERALKIKLSFEVAKIQEARKDEEERRNEESRAQQRKDKKEKEKCQRNLERIQRNQEDAEFYEEEKLHEERSRKREFQQKHEKRLVEAERLRVLEVERHAILKQQQHERKQDTYQRERKRQQVEQQRVQLAENKWESTEQQLFCREQQIEKERRAQQRLSKKKFVKAEKNRRQKEKEYRKTLILQNKDLQVKLEIGQERTTTAATKRRHKYEEVVLLKDEKTQDCWDYIQRTQDRKETTFKKREHHKKEHRKQRQMRILLELEGNKLKKMLQERHSHLSVQRQRSAKLTKLSYLHKKTKQKEFKLRKIKEQSQNILIQTGHVRRTMERRKEHIEKIVHQLKVDDKWGPAENLLQTIAKGTHIEIAGSGAARPARPQKSSTFLSSPRSGKHLRNTHQNSQSGDDCMNRMNSISSRSLLAASSYRGNPNVGNNRYDSSHDNNKRNIQSGFVGGGGGGGGGGGEEGGVDGLPSSMHYISTPQHVMRMKRARKWLNLSARKFESIFGRVDEKQDHLTSLYHGIK